VLPLPPLFSLTLVLFAACPLDTGLTVAALAPAPGVTSPFLLAILLTVLVDTPLSPVFLVVCRFFLVPVRVRSRFGVPTSPNLLATT
jgi:hypothetical protein